LVERKDFGWDLILKNGIIINRVPNPGNRFYMYSSDGEDEVIGYLGQSVNIDQRPILSHERGKITMRHPHANLTIDIVGAHLEVAWETTPDQRLMDCFDLGMYSFRILLRGVLGSPLM
jgi:hypothetical protein